MEVRNPNRPRALNAPQGGLIPDSFRDRAYRGDLNGGANLVYIGFARPGSAEGSLVWQIMFITYDGSTPVSITWPIAPDGAASNDYQFSWTARASYTYV